MGLGGRADNIDHNSDVALAGCGIMRLECPTRQTDRVELEVRLAARTECFYCRLRPYPGGT
jgi:hypothetical protein